MEKEKRRFFGGKLFVPPDAKPRSEANKWVCRYEKAHLKAYLRGDKFFFFGKDKEGKPLINKVQEIWI